ncbi:MAG: TldD/PmbA family protein [Deltaproteobacteria bacterium]|nr:TldD/PmbA family protein [Deltaproteobacteria bacterium]
MNPDIDDLKQVVKKLMCNQGIEFVDVFFEEKKGSSIVFENGKVDRLRSGIDSGLGIRVIKNHRTYYGYSTQTDMKMVKKLATAIKNAFVSNPLDRDVSFEFGDMPPVSQIQLDPAQVGISEKIGLLKRADDVVRSHGTEVIQAQCIFFDEQRRVLQINSDGAILDFERKGLVFIVHVTARLGDVLQTGYESVGGQVGMELFDGGMIDKVAKTSTTRALMMLRARETPSGRMPVVLESEAGGTMIHEAVGHGLEADIVGEKMSVYTGKLGEKIAAETVSVIDDPTMPNRRGSYPFDDEGVMSRRSVLVENGYLKGFMYDRLSALKQGAASTGNGRRESYRHKPIPRMSNTYIAPSTYNPAEILHSTPSGLLVRKMGGGEVNTVNGDFVFEVAEGYLIENGRQGEPVRGATLVGNGPKVLLNIDMVGADLGFSIGTCGKDGQGAPVSDAQPTLRIGTPDQPETWLTVGGTV